MECFVCFKTINTKELSAHIEQHNPYNATKVSDSPLSRLSAISQHSILLLIYIRWCWFDMELETLRFDMVWEFDIFDINICDISISV